MRRLQPTPLGRSRAWVPCAHRTRVSCASSSSVCAWAAPVPVVGCGWVPSAWAVITSFAGVCPLSRSPIRTQAWDSAQPSPGRAHPSCQPCARCFDQWAYSVGGTLGRSHPLHVLCMPSWVFQQHYMGCVALGQAGAFHSLGHSLWGRRGECRGGPVRPSWVGRGSRTATVFPEALLGLSPEGPVLPAPYPLSPAHSCGHPGDPGCVEHPHEVRGQLQGEEGSLREESSSAWGWLRPFLPPSAECPAGTFGVNCSGSCSCRGAPCDRVTGQCLCPPGRTGDDCGAGEWPACSVVPSHP